MRHGRTVHAPLEMAWTLVGVPALLLTACAVGQPARNVSTERGWKIPASHQTRSGPCRTVLLEGRAVRGVLFGAECGPSVPTSAQRSAPEPVTGYWEATSDVINSIELDLRRGLEDERSKFRKMAHVPGADETNVERAFGAVSAVD